MTDTIEYYKVVREWKGDLVSSMGGLGPARVIYVPGEWISAPKEMRDINHNICVFDTLYSAEKLYTAWHQIWKCVCEEVHPPTRWSSMDSFCRARSIRAAIRNQFPSPALAARHDAWGWPTGTVMAERIKLVERVK